MGKIKTPRDYVGHDIIVTNSNGSLKICKLVREHPKTYRGTWLPDIGSRYTQYISLIPKSSVLFAGKLTGNMAVLIQASCDMVCHYSSEINDIRNKISIKKAEYITTFEKELDDGAKKKD